MSWYDNLYKIKHETVECAIKLWCGNKDIIQLVNKGINLVYRFQSEKILKYIRITHKNIRSINDLNSAIEYQKFLFHSDTKIRTTYFSY